MATPFAAIGKTGQTGSYMIGDAARGIGTAVGISKQQDRVNQNKGVLTDGTYNMTQAYDEKMSPYVDSGQDALTALNSTDTNVANYDTGFSMDGWETDPGYEFAKQEGIDALDQSAAAGGTLHSGSEQQALMEYGTNLGNQAYSDIYDRKMSEYTDSRDYNTSLDASNLDRGIDLNSTLNDQGYSANMANANMENSLLSNEMYGMMDLNTTMGELSAGRANNVGTSVNNNFQLAGDGFDNVMGSMGGSFGG